MTAYAAFQNPTECSFQKWKEGVKCNEKNANSRDNNKKAERWKFKWRNQSLLISTGKGKAPRNHRQYHNNNKQDGCPYTNMKQ